MFSETGSHISQVSLEFVEDDPKHNYDPPTTFQVLESRQVHTTTTTTLDLHGAGEQAQCACYTGIVLVDPLCVQSLQRALIKFYRSHSSLGFMTLGFDISHILLDHQKHKWQLKTFCFGDRVL